MANLFLAQGETLNVVDMTGTPTVARVQGDPDTQENNANAGNSGPGQQYDASGLWRGYLGDGYLDINGDGGIKADFQFDTPALAEGEAADVLMSLRIASGSNDARPMSVAIDGGATSQSQDTQTDGWDSWEVRTFTVEVTGPGPHTGQIVQDTNQGSPNIDAVVVHTVGSAPDFDTLAFSSPATFAVDEGTTAVGAILAEDADEGEVTYELGTGGDEAAFDIDPQTGALSFATAPDFETDAQSYAITVEATKGGETVSQQVTVTVDDVVEASEPQIDQITLQGEEAVIPAGADTFHRDQADIQAAEAAGDTDTLEAEREGEPGSDKNGEPLDAFGLRPDYSGFGYTDFGGDGDGSAGDEKMTWSVNVAEAGRYDLHVRYASTGNAGDRPLDVIVDGQTQIAAQDFQGSGFENWDVLTVQVLLEAGDNDITLAIPAGENNGPNVDAAALTTVGAAPVFPATNVAPVFDDAVATASVAEGTTAVHDFAAADGNADDAVTYALGGADAAAFAISAEGELSFAAAPDFEAPADDGADNDYEVTVIASDGVVSTSQDVVVTVTDEAEDQGAGGITATAVAFDENVAGATVATVVVDDPDTTYMAADLTLSGDDAGSFVLVDGAGGIELALAPGASLDAEAPVQPPVTISLAADSGVTTIFTPSPTDVNEAPAAPALAGVTVTEGVAGATAGTLSADDPEGGAVTFSVDPASDFEVVGDELKLKDGVSLDFEAGATVDVDVTATDDAENTSTATVTVQVGDVDEDDGGPVEIDFSSATITSYTSNQDQGGTVTVAPDGSSLQLAGNLWKRVTIGQDYEITDDTRLEVTLAQTATPSEIVAIGFDLDETFTDNDASVYQLAGTQGFGPFPNVSGTDNGDGTTSFVIDLSAHAGTTISSLVFAADDDNASNGLGAPTFSDVRLVEAEPDAGGNQAPIVVGGGVADFAVDEGGAVEVDLPFVDADGPSPLSYSAVITDGDGVDVTAAFGLTLDGAVLSGDLPDGVAPGAYTVTVTADDGQATTSDAFTLTVNDVNEAPEIDPGAAPEPIFGAVGQAIDPIVLADFGGFFLDPDGDPLELSVQGLPAGLTLEEGVIFGTPSEAGDGTFTVVASDGEFTAELEIGLILDAPQTGETTFIEAESFTGLAGAENFFATGQASASGDQLIRVNQNQSGAVTTDLGSKGILPGWHTVSIDVYDEADGSATFSLSIGDTVLATDLSFDADGEFLNPGANRGSAGQPGNLKRITLDTPVQIEAGDVLTLTGQADGELLRIDRVGLTRIEAPNQQPTAPTLDDATVDENAAGAVVGAVASTDPDGDDAAITFGVDDARFEVVAGQLKLAPGTSLDFETEPSVTVTVTATDEGGATASETFTIAVGDLDEEPGAVALSASSVDENAEGAVIGTLTAADGDGGTVVGFTTTDPRFTVVNGNELALAPGTALDHEAAEQVTVDVLADGAAEATTLTIDVNDVDEAPTLTGTVDAATVPAEGGSVSLAGLTAEDEDEGQTPTLGVRLANGDPAPSGVVIEDGALTIPSGLDAGTLEFEVFATDGTLESEAVPLTVSVGQPAPFETVILQGEDFTLLNAAGDTNPNLIRTETQNWERDGSPLNPEPNDTQPNPDDETFNELGLRPDYSGTGYLDPQGNDTGAQAEIAFDVPAGAYEVTVRLANGAGQDRPITLDFGGGVTATIADTQTGEFYLWETRTVAVTLPGGPGTLTIEQDAAQGGPNIDAVAIHEPGVVPVFVEPAADISADEDGNLTAAPADASVAADDRGAVEFDLAGVDADIETIEVSLDGGTTFVPASVTGAGGDRTATVDLSAAAPGSTASVVFRLTDDDGNTIDETATVVIEDEAVGPYSFELQLETRDGSVTIDDTVGTAGPALTQIRDPQNDEGSGGGRGPDGLWDDFTGDGYMDMGGNAGDAIVFDVTVPADGDYSFSFRYAHTTASGRPMTLSVDGSEAATIPFPGTGAFDAWQEATLEVALTAGPNTIRLENVGANGPNLDRVVVTGGDDTGGTPGDPEPGPRDTIAINFQDGTAPEAQGYLVDNFEGFGDRGNGQTYGWITEASAVDADGTANTPIDGGAYPEIAINERTGGQFADYDPRLQGYAHFDLGSYPERTGWEIEVENGWYEVTVSVGDTGGPNDSDNQLLVEGELATAWEPTDEFKSQLVTVLANVQDGHLTLAAPDGTITEMQYLEVRALPDLTPNDGNPAPVDYAELTGPVALPPGGDPQPIGFGDGLRPDDIDPTASFAFDVAVAGDRGGVLETSLNDQTVRLFETLTGEEVDISLNTTGGFDAVVINPDGTLKENTSYTIEVDGLLDRGPNEGAGGPREFQKYTTSFVTGEAPEVVDRDVAFADEVMATEGGFASLTFSPDGSQLYVSTLYGAIIRWDLDPQTGEIVASSREAFAPAALQGEAIIGLAFDPNDDDRIWITANDGGLDDADDFTGQVWTIDVDPDAAGFDAEATLRIEGLPRSERDHLSNSLAFRENPDAGQAGEPSHLLYLIQGSNSAMGAPDSAWGWRAERALAAAVLEIDPDAVATGGALDVQTEADWTATKNDTSLDPLNDTNNPNTYQDSGDGNLFVPGFYNPFADDAPVRVFASGQRNAYDLVWHSNGLLYVPTNGSAGGGRAPDDPSTPQDEGITGIPTRNDYLFAVEEGGFYGHPNPIRGEFILNGGNPTAGNDPAEVGTYDVGTDPDPNYRGFAFDFGRNVSPNGAAEYTADVFGSNLKGAVIVTQYSNPDTLIALTPGPDGNIQASQVIQREDGSTIEYSDPLDVIVNPVTGQMYMVTFERNADFGTSSKLVLLNPVAGDVTGDNTADVGGDLEIVVIDATDPMNVLFEVDGVDADIQSIQVSFNQGAPVDVTLDGQGQFTADLSGFDGQVTATLTVEDDDDNTASDGVSFTPGDAPQPSTFIDALDFTNLDAGSTIIRDIDDPSTHEDNSSTDTDDDGLNDGYDGDGYVDFGGGAGDKVSFDVTAATAGVYTLTVRMANGSDNARPIELSVDGQSVTIADTSTGSFGTWQDFPVQLTLEQGVNTVTVAQTTGAGGPNIDSVSVALDAATDGTADEGGDLALTVVNDSNPAAVVFAVTGDDDDIETFSVSVNGGAAQTVTPDGQGQFTLDLDGLTGTVSVALTVADEVPNTASTSASVDLGDDGTPNDGTEVVDGKTFVVYEAENAALTGTTDEVTVGEDDRGQSGGAFVDFDGAGPVSITWTIEVPEAGTYQVDFLYALATGKDPRPMELSIDGGASQTVPFPANSNQDETVWGPSTVSLDLAAGVHMLELSATGAASPNLDYLRVTAAPLTGDLTADEGGDLALSVVDQSDAGAVVFQVDGLDPDITEVTVSFNGGTPVTVEPDANGQFTADTGIAFGTVDAELVVTDGTNFADAGASFSVAPDGNPNADIAVQSGDPTFFDDRLHFSFLQNDSASNPDRSFKDSATVTITNTGTEDLEFAAAEVTGPFDLADPAQLDGLTLGAGDSIDVDVLFDATEIQPKPGNGQNGVQEGALTLTTNDAEDPIVTVDLAGFWQARDEGGWEPNVNEVWEVFGFGNFIEGLALNGGGENSVLNFFDLYIPQDETEVLSPYWQIADGVDSATITQIAAFHGDGGASMGIHGPGDKSGSNDIGFGSHNGTHNQRLLPLEGGQFFAETFDRGDIPDGWVGDDVFGIEVAGLSTDPTLNPTGSGVPTQADLDSTYPGQGYTVTNGVVFDAQGNEVPDGYTVRMFQAVDADGDAIENVFLGVMDYTGINYDYNDNMFIIEGVAPVGTGGSLAVSGLDDAAADDRLVFTNIDNPANGAQNFRNAAEVTITNDGTGTLDVTGLTIGGADAGDFEVSGLPGPIAPGDSATVTVTFVGSDPADDGAAELRQATLTVESDAAGPAPVIQLAGLAQLQSESGEEPTVAQIVEAFGYGTDVQQGQLNGGGAVETIGDEVLMPYLERLDGSQPVEVINLAAFLQQTDISRLHIHELEDDGLTELFAGDDQQGQTVLPDGLVEGAGDTGSVARASIDRDEPFGLKVTVDDRPTFAAWTDPEANKEDPELGVNDGGHYIRFFQAKDASGDVIEGTFIGIQDYPGGGNFDYNDAMFLVRNVQPHTLTAANDADSDGINDALQTDADQDGLVAFFDDEDDGGTPITQTPFGGTPWAVDGDGVTVMASSFDEGGQGVAYNDDGTKQGDQSVRPGANVDISNGTGAIGYTNAGEWLEYTIEVAEAGEHTLVFNTSSPSNGRALEASFAQGGTVYETATAQVPNTGAYTTYADTQAVTVDLQAGVQVLRVTFPINQQDLMSFTLVPVEPDQNEAPVGTDIAAQDATEGQGFALDVSGSFADDDPLTFTADGLPSGLSISEAGVITGTPTADGVFSVTVTASDGELAASESFTLTVADEATGDGQAPFPGPDAPGLVNGSITVDAADYDQGGQGVAYNDAPGLSGGTNGGRAGSDVEITGLGDVGWIADDEWLEYTVDLAAGTYDLDLLMAFGSSGARSATVEFYRPGEATPYASSGAIANPGTGGWTNFQTRSASDIALEGGEQIVRVTFNGGSQDIRSFTLTQTDADENQPPVAGEFADQSVQEGAAISLDLSGVFSDPDAGDTLSYTVSGLDGLTVSPSGVVTGTAPQVGADTEFEVTVTASDGELQASETFTLTVEDEPVAGPEQTPVPGPDAPVLGQSLTVDATNFDAGGQGVSWNDDPGLDGGSGGGRPDADVELVGGEQDIGYVEQGEWVEYTIDVAEAGSYDLSLVAKTPIGGNTVTVSLGDGPALATVALPDSNGASTGFGGTAFAPTAAQQVELAAGEQTLRFTFDGAPADNGYLLDMRSFSLEAADTGDGGTGDGGTGDGGSGDDGTGGGTGGEVVGQAGTVTFAQADAGAWQSVTFAQALENPAVVMGPISFNGSQPATMRVREVTDTGFEFQLDEWDYLDGGHTTETVSWVAIESGVHQIGGQTVVAGVGSASEAGGSIAFGQGFDAVPVVAAQVTTTNDPDAVTDRIDDVTTTGFDVALDDEEANASTHAAESLAWIAVEQGGAAEAGLWAGATGNAVTDDPSTQSFGGEFADEFAFVADMQTEDGGDPAVVRLASLGGGAASLFVEEEGSADAETGHTTEVVGSFGVTTGVITSDDPLA